MLGLVWALYLAGRVGVEAVTRLPQVRAKLPPRRESQSPHSDRWSPAPAVVWLAREATLAAIVVGPLWLLLRDLGLPNLLPSAVIASPGDVRRVAIASILAWSLFVINLPAARQLVGRLLPAGDSKSDKHVDPRTMGATIGVLERVLVIALMPGGGPAAVGFVVASKTLARFKELDDKRFAERYLLGTMASVTIALVSSLVAQWIWSTSL